MFLACCEGEIKNEKVDVIKNSEAKSELQINTT